MQYIGEISALAASACWVITALVLASAGRVVGATVVNAVRIFIAICILCIIHWIAYDNLWPEIDNFSLLYLAISGVIGLAIGDQFLYRALIDAGPRLTTLVITSTPALTAIIAFAVLHETLSYVDVLAMLLTMSGIAIAILTRGEKNATKKYPRVKIGILFAFLGALGQAIGLVFAKLGMEESNPDIVHTLYQSGVTPLSATYIRMCFGGVGAIVLLLFYLLFKSSTREKNCRINFQVFFCILAGTIFGPVLGVWLGLISIENMDTGIAATLMSLSPIMILPFAKIIEKEQITTNAVVGAIVSIMGVALLLLN
ncbi:MAG: DMT family transporter [Phycisphaerae bacterium]|jgi:drug/metabolite transporter (DMT)-like permease|nr:DMT family transporter [Phycisphaerae bacterium]MBT7657067.1 DMT family transporter [Phycisphaerae bacterium]